MATINPVTKTEKEFGKQTDTFRSSRATAQIIIEPVKRLPALHLNELWEYRDLLYFMVRRDLKTRYTQTALGPLWILIQPLMSMVLYTLIFGVLAKLPSGGSPYAVFTYSGLLPWDFFNDSVSSGVGSLLNNRVLISKIYFPRLLIPLSQIISSLVDFSIAMVILFGMMLFYRIQPNWTVVFLPVYLLIAATTGVGVGLWCSGIVVRYRDFGNIIGYIMRFWMYATPVVYSIDIVPEQWRTLYMLNPMTNVLLGFRYALLGNLPPPEPVFVLFSLITGIVLLVTGMYRFKRVERNIIDVA